MPRLVKVSEDAVAEAAGRLRDGGVVAFPTETVYGLGADTFNPSAIERVFELKGRPLDNPLIAHVSDEGQARTVAAGWDDRCRRLADRFWPGPLTMVVTRADAVPAVATAGWPTVAVRAPAHGAARRLLAAFGGPISAPSANRSGHVSPTIAQHVADDFASTADLLILDGGPCAVGIESTVVDLSGHEPTVLRPGAVEVAALREVLGEVAAPPIVDQAAGPGTTSGHYAPRRPAERVHHGEVPGRLATLSEPATVLCFRAADVGPPHRAVEMPREPAAYAARLYAALREADAHDPERIVIEDPPSSGGPWLAVLDRLSRATGKETLG